MAWNDTMSVYILKSRRSQIWQKNLSTSKAWTPAESKTNIIPCQKSEICTVFNGRNWAKNGQIFISKWPKSVNSSRVKAWVLAVNLLSNFRGSKLEVLNDSSGFWFGENLIMICQFFTDKGLSSGREFSVKFSWIKAWSTEWFIGILIWQKFDNNLAILHG